MGSVMVWVLLVALVVVVLVLLAVIVLVRRPGGLGARAVPEGPTARAALTEAEESELAERRAELAARRAELDSAAEELVRSRGRADVEHRELRSKADALMASAHQARV